MKLNYVIKTENQKSYRFENQLNYAGTFFYLYQKNSFSIVPQLGFAGEIYESNYQYNQRMRKTSGDIFFGKFGFEVGRGQTLFWSECNVANKSKSDWQ
ncbi:MAG: hypothetical protein I4O51_10320 [Flavobacterium micromati]|nr:hypothetical protein [Flavobacterium micromati]